MANFEVEVLEAKISKLRKDLIIAMDNGNKKKEQVKALKDELQVEKLLTVQKDEQLQATNQKINSARDKDVQAFKLTDEYKIVLFIQYFKGFELLRRYLTKHNLGVNQEGLDFKAVDKEMETDEAAEARAAKGNVLEAMDVALEPIVGDDALAT